MEDQPTTDTLALTAEIVAAHVAHNSVHAAELPKLISAVHAALAGLVAAPPAPPAEPEHKPAISVRKSLASDDHIISMIDGKPYKALRRHLASHGLTDEEYRARYKLSADYPMVSRSYSAARATMAKAIGLGRKAGAKVGEAVQAAPERIEEVTAPAAGKRGRKPAAAKPGAPEPVPAEAAASPRKRRGKAAS